MYIARLLEKVITYVSKTFAAAVITGPRQSGKSTLLSHLFGKTGTYVSLDDPEKRRIILEDPSGFLKSLVPPVVLDEIQYIPEITTYLRPLIDKNRTPGQWFLTGSQQFSVMKSVSESLAGRAAVLALPPFHVSERTHMNTVVDYITKSTYPDPATRKIDTDIWYSSYLQTYLERDVRQIQNIGNMRDFEQCIRLLASRTGQILNYSEIARTIGTSVPTIQRWVSLLEATYIIFLLPPYHENFGKRISKSPKIYFMDPAFSCFLTGTRGDGAIMGPMAGALFETAVVSDVLKKMYAAGIKPELYYWKNQSGVEIDLVIPSEGKLIPCEIKSSTAIKSAFIKNLIYWNEITGSKAKTGILITASKEDIRLPHGLRHCNWKNVEWK